MGFHLNFLERDRGRSAPGLFFGDSFNKAVFPRAEINKISKKAEDDREGHVVGKWRLRPKESDVANLNLNVDAEAFVRRDHLAVFEGPIIAIEFKILLTGNGAHV